MALLESVILLGARSAQPSASTVAVGTLYCVTDEANIVERSNGATWDAYSPTGSTSASTVIADHSLVRGDGGAAGIQGSGVTLDDGNNLSGVASAAVGAALVPHSVATFGGQYVSPLVNDGSGGTAVTVDWEQGNEHRLLLTGNVTLSFAHPVDGGRYVLLLNTGAGGFSVTWPADVRFADTPTVTVASGRVDLFTFMYIADWGIYLGCYNQDYAGS